MARRQQTDLAISEALARTDEAEIGNRKLYQHARRADAVSMAIAGMTYEQIGKELDISPAAANNLVRRTIESTRNYAVDELRLLENARLDRAQAAIWSDVLQGDLEAVNTYLRISDRRAKMNGLDAPSKVQLAVSVRQEMEQALASLEEVILDAEVVEEPVDVVDDEASRAFNHETEEDSDADVDVEE